METKQSLLYNIQSGFHLKVHADGKWFIKLTSNLQNEMMRQAG